MAGLAPCSIDALPDAVLVHILASVDAELAARGALLLVCKRWQHVYVAEPGAWESLSTNLALPESAHKMAGLLQLARRTGRHVRSAGIQLDQPDAAVPPWMLQLLRCLHPERLRKLSLTGPPLTDVAATELRRFAPLPDPAPLTALPSLLELELHEDSSTEEGLRLPALSDFARLERFQALATAMQTPDGQQCRFTDWPEREVKYVRWKRGTGADGTAEGALRVRHAELDRRDAPPWDASFLRSILRAALLPGVPLRALAVAESCIQDSTFRDCGALLAAVTKLTVYSNAERGSGTHEALQAALQALVVLVPGVRRLELSGTPAEHVWGAGWSLPSGLPPAVTALRHLEALAVADAQLPSLPEGPYLTGLTYLNLRGNSLAGPLPPALGAATALRALRLQFNPQLCLTPACVDTLARLPRLTSICLEETCASPAQAAHLARRLPQLQFVEGIGIITGWTGYELECLT